MDEDGHWRAEAMQEPDAESLAKLAEFLGEFLDQLDQSEAREAPPLN